MADRRAALDRTQMLAFEGTGVSGRLRSLVEARDVAGFTLFRRLNVESPEQVRALTRALQSAAGAGRVPLLIATDQEGGQLNAIGEGATHFAGNMALGAVGDEGLADRVGRAIGRELRAVGVNVDYAPVCDVATNPANPSLGIRAFGDSPRDAGRLAGAFVRGLQAEGVAATAKHFPGKGEAAVDPHRALPRLDMDLERFEALEFVPFRAAMAAGARLVMVGHYAVPALTGDPDLPSSLSPRLVREVLRGRLGFEGVVITDALDMGALGEGTDGSVAVAALGAGADLLLWGPGPPGGDPLRPALELDDRVAAGALDLVGSNARVAALRSWVGGFDQPPLDVVGCAAHRDLAREVAERSITLVRDDRGLLPLRPGADARMAVIAPAPRDLTPADTSSSVALGLASALRRRHANVDQILLSHVPTPAKIAGLRDVAASFDVLVVGTLHAVGAPEQGEVVRALLDTGVPTVWVALRTPFDLVTCPEAPTYVCTYGILPPSVEALAAALWGEIPFSGRLPAAIGGLYPTGHGVGVTP